MRRTKPKSQPRRRSSGSLSAGFPRKSAMKIHTLEESLRSCGDWTLATRLRLSARKLTDSGRELTRGSSWNDLKMSHSMRQMNSDDHSTESEQAPHGSRRSALRKGASLKKMRRSNLQGRRRDGDGADDESSTSSVPHRRRRHSLDPSGSLRGDRIARTLSWKRRKDRSYNPRYAMSMPTTEAEKKNVSFGQLEARLFDEIIAGDNPAVKKGVALTMGWKYTVSDSMSIEEFEANRVPRRRLHELRVTEKEREHRLRASGYSQKQIEKAAKNIDKARHKRSQTLGRLKKAYREGGGSFEAADQDTVTENVLKFVSRLRAKISNKNEEIGTPEALIHVESKPRNNTKTRQRRNS